MDNEAADENGVEKLFWLSAERLERYFQER
jgi:hypothetical protein